MCEVKKDEPSLLHSCFMGVKYIPVDEVDQNKMEKPQQSTSCWENQPSFPFLVQGKCIPHVTDKIFQLLDRNTMAKCRLVAKDWKIFVDQRTSLWGKVRTHT